MRTKETTTQWGGRGESLWHPPCSERSEKTWLCVAVVVVVVLWFLQMLPIKELWNYSHRWPVLYPQWWWRRLLDFHQENNLSVDSTATNLRKLSSCCLPKKQVIFGVSFFLFLIFFGEVLTGKHGNQLHLKCLCLNTSVTFLPALRLVDYFWVL